MQEAIYIQIFYVYMYVYNYIVLKTESDLKSLLPGYIVYKTKTKK